MYTLYIGVQTINAVPNENFNRNILLELLLK